MSLGRAVRHAVNPLSTRASGALMSAARRWGPRQPEGAVMSRTGQGRPWPASEDLGVRVVMRTPAGHTAPPGTIPGWSWIPDGHGLHPLVDAMPLWVRCWYRTPFIDRYAHAWMWHHGGWEISAPYVDPDDPAGVREPRNPRVPRPSGAAALDHP